MYDVIVVGSRVAGSSTAMLLAGSGLRGRYPAFEGVDAVYSPRRIILDPLLPEVARAAGAEVRERFAVEELLSDNGRVTGIRRRHKGGRRSPSAATPTGRTCRWRAARSTPASGGPSGPGRPTTA